MKKPIDSASTPADINAKYEEIIAFCKKHGLDFEISKESINKSRKNYRAWCRRHGLTPKNAF